MKINIDQISRVALAIAGLTAIIIGAAKVFIPAPFYSYHSVNGMIDASTFNEMNSTSILILALGIYLVAGSIWTRFQTSAIYIGIVSFLAVALSRIAAIVMTSWPSEQLQMALASEMIIAIILAAIAYTKSQKSHQIPLNA